MAEPVFDQNTYAGELYGEIIFPALVPAMGLVDKGLVTLKTGVKKRAIMRVGEVEVEFQNPACNFTAQDGGLTLGERYLDPVEYAVMIEMCYKDLKEGWDALKLKKGTINDYHPPETLEKAFIEIVQQKIAIMNEQMYIRGKDGVTAGEISFTAPYPGILERLRADTDVNKIVTSDVAGTSFALTGVTTAANGVVTVASTANLRSGDRVTLFGLNGNQQVGGTSINGQSFTITVTSATQFRLNKAVTGATPATSGTVYFYNQSNVLALLSYVYSIIPEQVLDNPSLKIWVPRSVANAYSFIQATNANAGGSFYTGKKEMDFLGNLLTVVPYLPDGNIIIAPSTHIQLAIDDTGDETNIQTIWMGDKTADWKYRYRAGMKSDINHAQGQDITLISPDIIAGS
jgi:hypothetical protein